MEVNTIHTPAPTRSLLRMCYRFYPGHLPGWLLTNKAIIEQGLQQLYRSVIWNWRGSDVLHLLSPATISSPLIALATATHFGIYFAFRASPQEAHTFNLLHQDIWDVLPKLGSDLKVLDPDIFVYLLNSPVLALQGLPPWKVILPSFMTLDVQLGVLNVRVEVVRGIHVNVPASEMRSALEAIIKQPGEKVVGQGAVVTSSTKECGSPVHASGPPHLVALEFKVRRA
jgi:hypothetical protein